MRQIFWDFLVQTDQPIQAKRPNLINVGALGIVEYSFIAIAPRSTLAWSDRVLSNGQIELFDI